MIQFKIIDPGDEVKSQTEAATPIAVRASQDPEDLETADDMLDRDSQPGMQAVDGPLHRGQRTLFRGFERQHGQPMLMLKPLIPQIHHGMNIRWQAGAVFAAQPQVMAAPRGVCGGHDTPGVQVDQRFAFHRVTLALAAVVAALFFLAVPPAFPSHPRLPP